MTCAEIRSYRIDAAASSITAIATATLGRYTFRFPDVAGSIDWVPSRRERSHVTLHVTTASVSGNLALATDVIRSPDFLDVERYPRARFWSTGFAIETPDRGLVRGVLELHGVSRRIQVPVRFGFVDGRLRIDSEFSIDRRDYGIESDGPLDMLVNDDVVVRLRLVAPTQRMGLRSQPANCLNQFAP